MVAMTIGTSNQKKKFAVDKEGSRGAILLIIFWQQPWPRSFLVRCYSLEAIRFGLSFCTNEGTCDLLARFGVVHQVRRVGLL